MSSNFRPQSWGRLRQFYRPLGFFWFFLLENPMPIKFLVLPGMGGFGRGVSANLNLWARGFFWAKYRTVLSQPVLQNASFRKTVLNSFFIIICFFGSWLNRIASTQANEQNLSKLLTNKTGNKRAFLKSFWKRREVHTRIFGLPSFTKTYFSHI